MGVGLGGCAVAIPVRRSPATVGFAAQLGAEELAASGLLHVCSLAFIAVATRALGLDGFGVYRVVLQVLTVAALLSYAGLGAQAVRSVALLRASGEHAAARSLALGSAVAAAALSGLGAAAIFA